MRWVETFESADGTRLAYHLRPGDGDGDPLICVPGGPMQASAYLGDLGGLAAHRSLVLLDLRGTGVFGRTGGPGHVPLRSPGRGHRGAARRISGWRRVDLLGHSAGGTLALLYAAGHPERVRRLALVTPSPRPAGLDVTDADRREVAELRRGEPWFPVAWAAFERIWSGEATEENWAAIAPFTRGGWDAADQAHAARRSPQTNEEAARLFYSAGALDPEAIRSAVAELPAPVLLLAGQYDVGLPPKVATEYGALFPDAELVVQPGAGHYPWLDDPTAFTQTVATFLGR